MGAMTRSFRIPLSSEPVNQSSTMRPVITTSDDQDTTINISIHEPALTEDNLGLKTWASSFVLARKWHQLRHRLPALPALPSSTNHHDAILELGAGTGLVGLAAAAVLQANVLLTDLEEIVPNLKRNIEDNYEFIAERRGDIRAAVLDWTKPEKIVYAASEGDEGEDSDGEEDGKISRKEDDERKGQFPLVVSADPIYSTNHPKWLVQTIGYHLSRTEDARAIVIIPIRDAYKPEREDFRARMMGIGLVTDFEETDIGYDDWSEGRAPRGEDELKEVECWLTCWKWADKAEQTES